REYLGAKRAENYSETTLKHHYRLLCLVVDSAVDEGLLSHNVVKRVKSPQATKPRADHFIDDAAQHRLLAVIAEWLTQEHHPLRVTTAMAGYLALMTGMRRGELCAVKWSDVVTRLDPKARRERIEIRVQRAVEIGDRTARFKDPKSSAGFRNIAIS